MSEIKLHPECSPTEESIIIPISETSPPPNEVSTPILPPDEVFIPILDIPAPESIPEIQISWESQTIRTITDLQNKEAIKDGIITELKNTIKEEEQTITFFHSRQEWIKGLTEKMTKMLNSSLGWREKISAAKGIAKEISEANK